MKVKLSNPAKLEISEISLPSKLKFLRLLIFDKPEISVIALSENTKLYKDVRPDKSGIAVRLFLNKCSSIKFSNSVIAEISFISLSEMDKTLRDVKFFNAELSSILLSNKYNSLNSTNLLNGSKLSILFPFIINS